MQVNIKTYKPFTAAVNDLKEKYGEKFQYYNGFHDSQLSLTEFIDNFVDTDTVADATIDPNANSATKDIRTLMNDMMKPFQKLLAFNKIFHDTCKFYGIDTAKEWLECEWNGLFYMHNASTSSFLPYCFAYDFDDLVEKGMFFIDHFGAKPAKHLDTFNSHVLEFVSWVANRSSGAVGLPSYLIYSFWFWKKDCENGYILKSPEYYRDQQFQKVIYDLNQPYMRLTESTFSNFTIMDREYLMEIFGGREYPDGTFVIDYIEDIIEYQKAFMRMVSKIREEQMMTFPVLTFSLLYQNGKFVDEDFAIWAIKHNMEWSDSNLFVDSSVNSLSNCCRLKSNIEDLGYFNSIGGTALKVGSVKVSTINLARIALDTNSEEEYLKELEKRVYINCIALDRVRHIIKRNVEKGLLPNFTYNLVDFPHLYNTLGFIGVYETMKKFGYIRVDELGDTYYTDKASEFGNKIFKTMRATADKFIKDNNCDYQINTEQIPGESAAAKLMQKDKFFYPNADIYDLPLYGNQFIPLGIKTTGQERVRIASEFDGYCSGGSILHYNIDAPFDSFEKAWKMVNYIADQGVTYFAFNTKIQACKNNHAFYGSVCPVCGEPVETEFTRIVGFYTAVRTYSKARKAEFEMRRWTDINAEAERV